MLLLILIFAAAIVFAVIGMAPTSVASGSAVLFMTLTGVLDFRIALNEFNLPVIVMLLRNGDHDPQPAESQRPD